MSAAKLHLALAALMGCLGVGLLAAAAHVAGGDQVRLAGQMLLFQAPTLIAATAARRAGLLRDLPARIAISAIALGACLFSADMTRRGFSGAALFANAAPSGGFAMLGGWLLLAFAALAAPRG